MSNKAKVNMEKNWDSYYNRYLTGLGLEQLGYSPEEICNHLGYADTHGWNRAKRRFEYSTNCPDRKRKTAEEKEALYRRGIELQGRGMTNTEISNELGFPYPNGRYSFQYYYKHSKAEETVDEEANSVNVIEEMSRVIENMFEKITEEIANAKEQLIDLYNEVQP